jgi:GDPmannose 4,6-dehydratase
MWLMLQQDEPDDYVVAMGVMHTGKDLVDAAFGHAGLDPAKHVELDPAFLRPAEVNELCGDATKARTNLGWEPKVQFPELVAMMVDADLARVRREIEMEKYRSR